MRRRLRHRQGPIAWVLLALVLLVLLHGIFGAGAPQYLSVISGRVLKVSTTQLTLSVAGTPGVERSFIITSGTTLYLSHTGGPVAPTQLLANGSFVNVVGVSDGSGFDARSITLKATPVYGRLEGWGTGRLIVAVPNVGGLTIGVTPDTWFRFQSSDPGVLRSGAAVSAFVWITAQGGYWAEWVRVSP